MFLQFFGGYSNCFSNLPVMLYISALRRCQSSYCWIRISSVYNLVSDEIVVSGVSLMLLSETKTVD